MEVAAQHVDPGVEGGTGAGVEPDRAEERPRRRVWTNAKYTPATAATPGRRTVSAGERRSVWVKNWAIVVAR